MGDTIYETRLFTVLNQNKTADGRWYTSSTTPYVRLTMDCVRASGGLLFPNPELKERNDRERHERDEWWTQKHSAIEVWKRRRKGLPV